MSEPVRHKGMIFLLGLCFGWVLSRSGAADYTFIQKMFLFQDVQLYGIIGVAVLVTMPGLWLLKRRGIPVQPKPSHSGNFLGSALFGIGWSITGMCPGPILVNIGEGKVYALAALAGALLGAYLLGAFYPRLQRLLGLPHIQEGPGTG